MINDSCLMNEEERLKIKKALIDYVLHTLEGYICSEDGEIFPAVLKALFEYF